VLIYVFDSAEDLAIAVARRFADLLQRKPDAVLGFATGRTPLGTYAELQRIHRRGGIDFSGATTFNLDEFVGVDATHPGSFRRYMELKLFAGVNVERSRINFLDGAAADLDAECARYEEAIDRCGGIDLQMLGIGANGHVGFNEPGDALAARTHRVVLHETTRRDNAGQFGGDAARVPREALSMGMGTILRARSVALMASGERKARCVERAIFGGVTTRLPASFLQLHGGVELYLDRGAAALVPPESWAALPAPPGLSPHDR
jgi:glucosamine-6-phosphate deaminase